MKFTFLLLLFQREIDKNEIKELKTKVSYSCTSTCLKYLFLIISEMVNVFHKNYVYILITLILHTIPSLQHENDVKELRSKVG